MDKRMVLRDSQAALLTSPREACAQIGRRVWARETPEEPADRMPLTPHLVQVFHRPTFQQLTPPVQVSRGDVLLRGGSIPFRHWWVIIKPALTGHAVLPMRIH